MTDHSAAASAVGYLYQFQHGLYLLVKADPTAVVHIERLDDVEFVKPGDPSKLTQLKHHLRKQGNLTDASPDIWKTLNVWADLVETKQVSVPGTLFLLLTTDKAQEGSLASMWLPGVSMDVDAIFSKLHEIADASEQSLIQDVMAKLSALPSGRREHLLESITVLDDAPHILDVEAQIKHEFLLSTRRNRIQHLYERILGWWFNKIITQLATAKTAKITGAELYEKVIRVAETLRDDDLPIDYDDVIAPDSDLAKDDRQFVRQLKVLEYGEKKLRLCIRDYYRASEQRGRWLREGLVTPDEIPDYDRKLAEEWAHYFETACVDVYAESTEQQQVEVGRDVLKWAEFTCSKRIRPNCVEEYVKRGSFHLLADRPTLDVGWHPNFRDRVPKGSGKA